MIRHGRTSSGRQRWRCKPCKITTLNEIDSTAKHLDEFLAWLLSRRRQVDLPGGGRSFRRRCEPLWQLWPFSPIVDEEPIVEPVEEPAEEPAPPAPAPEPAPAHVHFSSCKQAREAGAAPLYRGDPGYSSRLDRDNDGVACE